MTTLEITYPTQHSVQRFNELLKVARRLTMGLALRSTRARANSRSSSIREDRAHTAKAEPRWTRETDNPFDVPTSTYRDAIP